MEQRISLKIATEVPATNTQAEPSGCRKYEASVRLHAMQSGKGREVGRLAAELQASHARITELEARIDVDPLTETLNRRGFERELTRSLAYVKRYAVSAALVYLDLDDFKPVNDRHGHAAGDAVLKAIAATLVRHVRASDVVARIGGDEFVVLLWNVKRRSRSGIPSRKARAFSKCSRAPMPLCTRARWSGDRRWMAGLRDDIRR